MSDDNNLDYGKKESRHPHLEKWHIQEKHEFLKKNLPLYRKITGALIPPLQNSLEYFWEQPDDVTSPRKKKTGKRGKDEKDKCVRGKRCKKRDKSVRNRTESDVNMSGERTSSQESDNEAPKSPDIDADVTNVTPLSPDLKNDEEDLACPIGQRYLLDSFLGMLTTALAYAGLGSWKNLRALLSKDKSGLDGYLFDSELEDDLSVPTLALRRSRSGSTLDTQVSEKTERTFISPESINPEKVQKSISEKKKQESTNAVNEQKSTRLVREQNPTSPEKEQTGFLEPIDQANVPFVEKIPPPKERTTWQNSVLQNMDFTPSDDHLIMQYAEESIDHDTQEILAWLAAERIQKVFSLADDDYLHARFPVWLIKDVLLQGYLYLTRDALCFFLTVPGELTDTELADPDLTLHAGALGHKTAYYPFLLMYTHRFWGVLKPQTLSIYFSPTEQYFPAKVIDLNDAVSCEIETLGLSPDTSPVMTPSSSETLLSQLASEMFSPDEEAAEDVLSGVWFKIVCKSKKYRFHTSNIYSARHWCNSITKVIFQLHNCNAQREVVLKIPMEDLLDLRKNYVLAEDMAEQNNDTPVSFTFKYNTRGLQIGVPKRRSPHDLVHYLLFQNGLDFEHMLNLAMEEAKRAINVRKKLASKNMLDLEVSGHLSMVILTLCPDNALGISLAEKIVLANQHLVALNGKHQLGFDDNATDAVEKRRSISRLLNIIRPKIDTTFPCGPPDSSNSGDMLLSESRAAEIFDLWNDSINLQLPKPLSMQTLKNLKILIVTKRRPLEEIEARFEKKRSLEYRKPLDAYTFDNQSELTEDYIGEDASTVSILSAETVKSKLKLFKRGIKTASMMSGIWSANPEHFVSMSSDDPYYVSDEKYREFRLKNFRKHFSLGPDAELVASYFAYLRRSMPVYGKLYVGKEKVCFRSLLPGVSTKMILPIKELTTCAKETGMKINYSGLHIHDLSGKDLVLEFATQSTRDDARNMILARMESTPELPPSLDTESISEELKEDLRDECIDLAQTRIRAARLQLLEDKIGAASGLEFPLILEDDPITFTEVKPATSYHFVLLTIGSRGDVQPYIALGMGLLKEGHKVTIATHSEFEEWIVSYGINFREIAGNPVELMSLMVTHGSLSVSFLKEARAKFSGWIGELLETSWTACQGADILIESPSAMSGIHIAEALGIPYMRAFTMPWTRTRAYPHAFIVPDSKKGGSYNYMTHVMFENVFWKGISGQVNKWRVKTLGLPHTSLAKLQQNRIPFLYNVSPTIFPPSVDFPDCVKVTGYWFLNEGSNNYEPPKELVEFLATAKKNSEKIVYIGFGSIVVSDSKKLTKAVVEAVMELGVKCILNKGWSDRLGSKDDIEIDLPPQIYNSGAIPHDWLFSQIDAAVHHGGSGTTGATLRAGLPTIIKPFFGDQFFYGSRVEDLGVGMSLKNLNAKSLTKALKAITTDEKYLSRAQAVAHAMEQETGVLTAIAEIYSELAYSRSIINNIRQNLELRKQEKSDLQSSISDITSQNNQSQNVDVSDSELDSNPDPESELQADLDSELEESDTDGEDNDKHDDEIEGDGTMENDTHVYTSLTSGLMNLMTGISGNKPS